VFCVLLTRLNRPVPAVVCDVPLAFLLGEVVSVAAAGAPTLCVYFIPKGVRCALHAIKQHRHWIDDYCRRMCVYIEDRTVQSVPDQSINQSKFLTKSHTGRGEATSQHHHRGGNPCITK